MLRYFTISLLLVVFTPVLKVRAQQGDHPSEAVRSLLRPAPGQVVTAGQVKGSPLLFEGWEWADLYLTSEEEPLQVWVNFDMINELLLVKTNDKIQGALPARNWFEIRINGLEQETYRSHLEGFPDGVYKSLYKGKVSLWKKMRKNLEGDPLKQIFQLVNVYILRSSNTGGTPIELNTTSLIKALPQYTDAIEAWQLNHQSKCCNETTVTELLRELMSI